MRIAISYDLDTQKVFGHFGHAPAFQIYEVEENQVVSNRVVESNGTGHAVMVDLMKKENVNVVLCGRIGGHALEGLQEAGITAYICTEEEPAAALQAYLAGEAQEAHAADCGHEEGHSCCGGCHREPQLLFEGKNAGKTMRVHYRGTFNDGTQFDSSYDRQEPLMFTCAVGQMIRGFDEAVVNLAVGEETDIHLMPAEAYGERNPDAVFTVEIAQLPGSEELEVGQRVFLQNQFGQPFPVTVSDKNDTTITFDANHEMAGKELNFHIEVVSVED